MAERGAKSVTFLTPEDLEPIQAQLADHEARLVALEAGGGEPPDPGPGPDPGATLVVATWYSDMGRFAEMAAKGFNGVHEWAYTDGNSMGLLDLAHSCGMKAWLELSWCMENNQFHQDRLDWTCLPQYIAHPALAGWLSYDEPDLRNTPVGEMDKVYQAIKRKDPHHPIKVTIRYPFRSTGLPYIPYADIIAVDPYIIPYGPAEQAGDETAQSVAVCGNKPVFTDVQTFDWQGTFAPPDGRLPTMQEVEIMGTTSIQAQTHPTKAIFCYLEDELMGIPGDLAGTVAAWRALVPGAAKATTAKAHGEKWDKQKYPPLPAHPAIDALKKKMREEKRRHTPKPAQPKK